MTQPRVTVIAEAGVNHNGSVALARELVDAAAGAGADVVKFQTFKTEDLAQMSAPKAGYQTRTTSDEQSQFDMLKQLELSAEAHRELKARAESQGMRFLSTPFEQRSLHFLTQDLQLNMIKLPSSEITNVALLVDAARSGSSILLSTGMATLAEIESALQHITFGLARSDGYPTALELLSLYQEPRWRTQLFERVTLLQCTSEYPAAPSEANLAVMAALRTAFGVNVGYSDHTPGNVTALAAVALGATVVEKHLTLDRQLPGPDHLASSEPSQFQELVNGIREVEAALGVALKVPSPHELTNRHAMRKGLYAKRDIRSGDILTESDIAILRPEAAAGASEFFQLIGSVCPADVRAGDPLGYFGGAAS